MPVRVQLSRKKGWRMPANTVNVARPSKWGNPFKVGRDGTAAVVVERYLEKVTADAWQIAFIRKDLKGKNLACWCKPGEPCHADVLLELANR